MKVLTNSTISNFLSNLDKKRVSSPEAVFQINAAVSFIDWLSSTKAVSESDAIRYRNELYKAKHEFQRPKASLSNIPLKYVGFSLALLSLLLVGGGLYLRFYKNVKTPFAYSSAPIRAGRIISFQGRMTDTLGNPITAPIDVTYKFYTVPTGGTAITDSTRVCTAGPDQDGIFNTLIGNDSGGTGGTACNVEIPTDVFTTNTNVYLGVTIGTEITEMSPRQQIANVGYAINSETLQGMPPGQDVSNIPFINQDGNMLIAASNPGIRSITSSNFTISSALATTITSAGSGDITLSATEGGSLRFNTYNGTLEERMTVLNTGRVGIGITAPRALLDVNGDATVSGSLIAGGVVKIGDFNGAPSNVGNGSLYYENGTNKVYYWNATAWTELGAGAAQYFQRTLGSLAPTNITDDLNLGAVATASATVHLPGLTNNNAFFNLGTGNLGIGLINPSAKLDILGNLNVSTYATVGASLALGTSSAAAGPGNLDMSGNLTIAGAIKPGGAAGANGYLLTSSAGGVNTWTDPAAITSAANYWNITSGSIYPKNSTLDMFIGGTASASAKFAFMNVNSGTPTASIAGTLANVNTFIDGNGNLSTTNGQDLTLGNSSTYNSTGNILLNPNGTGNIGIGIISPAAKLDISGNLNVSTYATVGASLALGTSSAAAGPGNLDMSGNLTTLGSVTFSSLPTGIVHSTLGILSSSALDLSTEVTGLLSSLNGGTGADNSAATQYSVPYYSAVGVLGGALAPGTSGYVLSTNGVGGAPSWIPTGGVGSNYWEITNGSIYPVNATLDMFIGGVASASAKFVFLNVGSGTPTASIAGSLANVYTYLTGDGNLATTNMAALTIGGTTTGSIQLSPNGTTGLFIDNTGKVGIGTISPTSQLDVNGDLNVSTYATVGASLAVGYPNAFAGPGNAVFSGKVGIGDSTPGYPLSIVTATGDNTSFKVTNLGVTSQAIFNLEGPTSTNLSTGKAFAITINGESFARTQFYTDGKFGIGPGTSTRDTILSRSAANTFKISSDGVNGLGHLTITGYATAGASLALGTSNAAAGPGNLDMSGSLTVAGAIKPGGLAGTNGYVLTSTAGGVNTWTDPATLAGGINLWTMTNGSLYPKNSTIDMFIGGTASASAKFAFMNVNSGTPTASIAGTLANVNTFIDGNGNISTTNRQSLVLGNSTTYNSTGNILLSPNGTGNVGIGVTSPTLGKLQVGGGNIIVDTTYGIDTSTAGTLALGDIIANIINIGTNATARTITVGNITGTTAVNVNTGTAGTTYTTTNGIFTLNTGTGNISLGADAVAKTVTIGNATGATALALNSGTGDITLTSTDQIKLNSSKAAAGGTTEAFSIKSTVDLGAIDELLQVGDSAADMLTILGNGSVGIGTTAPGALLDIGLAGTTLGTLRLEGNTSGYVQIQSLAAAGSWTLTLPNSGGTSGYVLSTDGSGASSWIDVNTLITSVGQFWMRTGGSLTPLVNTDDLNMGNTATASAIVHLPGRTNEDAWFNLGTGSVGIGYTAPVAALSVNGGVHIGGTSDPGVGYLTVENDIRAVQYMDKNTNYYIAPANGGFISGNLRIDSQTPGTSQISFVNNASTVTYASMSADVNGIIYLTGGSQVGNTGTNVCVGDPTFQSCNGKIDAGTIDPPYTINGKRYSTYVASMTGVKEETTGQVALTTKSKTTNGYEYVIDFNSQTDGSDLWLFAKTTALRNRLSRLTVLMSPSDNARTWYKIDDARHTLTLFSSRPTTISYRLTAPRFDDEKWKNVTPNGSGGWVINDPDVASQNDIQIDGNGNIAGQVIANAGSEGGYQVLDELGVVLEETVLQAKTISAQVIAGLVSAQKIVSPLAEIEVLKVSNKIVSPVIETNEIKPIGKDVNVILGSAATPESDSGQARMTGELSKLIIKGLNNAPVATIDAAGNATFAGTLTAESVESRKSKVESLVAENASVSGTLVAKNIQSDTIDNLSSQIASSASVLSTNYQLLSTNINAVQSELAAIKSQPLPNPAYYQNIDASYGNLTVNDTANIYKAHIADSLMVGTLFIEPSSILALSDDLRISSLGTIRLFDDAVIVAKNGDITMKGGLSTSSLAIKNTNGDTVASIDASGSARFNEVIANKFSLQNIATQGAFIADSGIRNEGNEIIPAIKTSTEVAGTGVVPADIKEIIIYNDNVNENSLIYLTPTTQNIQGQLSVTKKVTCPADSTDSTGLTCVPYFVVSSTNAIHSASTFNWLIIN